MGFGRELSSGTGRRVEGVARVSLASLVDPLLRNGGCLSLLSQGVVATRSNGSFAPKSFVCLPRSDGAKG